MKLILLSQNTDILNRWENILADQFEEAIRCHTLEDLNAHMTSQEIIVLYHLSQGVEQEKAVYQFVNLYHRAHRMMVMVNGPEPEQGIRILRAGIHGYGNSYLKPDKLKAAVKVIEQGEVWAGQDILQKLLQIEIAAAQRNQSEVSDLNEKLSDREKQIVKEVLMGKTNKQIASALNITERTVKAHLSTIFRKTETRNRFELSVRLRPDDSK